MIDRSPDQLLALDLFRVTAARTSVFNAASLTFSPSRKSIAHAIGCTARGSASMKSIFWLVLIVPVCGTAALAAETPRPKKVLAPAFLYRLMKLVSHSRGPKPRWPNARNTPRCSYFGGRGIRSMVKGIGEIGDVCGEAPRIILEAHAET